MRIALHVTPRLAAVGLVTTLVAACSTETTASTASLVVRNATTDTLTYFAYERTATNLIDPRLSVNVDPLFASRVMPPGASSTVLLTAIDGYRTGADVRLFVYTVTGSRASLRGLVDAGSAQLSSSRFRIEISTATLH